MRSKGYSSWAGYVCLSVSQHLTSRMSNQGYPAIVNDIQPYPKRYLLMSLARVGARTDSNIIIIPLLLPYADTHYKTRAWPASTHTHWRSTQDMQYAPRISHFSAFYFV